MSFRSRKIFKEDKRYELDDGELLVTDEPAYWHNHVFANLLSAMDHFLRVSGLMRTMVIPPGEPFILQPHEFALAITEEILELGDDVVGRLKAAPASASSTMEPPASSTPIGAAKPR